MLYYIFLLNASFDRHDIVVLVVMLVVPDDEHTYPQHLDCYSHPSKIFTFSGIIIFHSHTHSHKFLCFVHTNSSHLVVHTHQSTTLKERRKTKDKQTHHVQKLRRRNHPKELLSSPRRRDPYPSSLPL